MVDDPNRMDDLDSFLKLLPPEVLKFAILGNWEYWGKIDRDQLSTIYNSHNCRLLINENITVELRNRDISIIGVDDYVGGEADFDIACKGLEEADYIVVLSHCPVYRDTIATNNRGPKIDMVLSGHTHGGQISLLGYAPFLPQGSGRYLKGRYHDIRPHLYVSKGIGTSVIPFRLGSRAEVAVFEI
jgi:predicted MPP superfamily phosphohydrolase